MRHVTAGGRMDHEDAARVVLVRAIEETLPDRIAPETLLEAHIAAGDPADGPAWIVRRAHYLVDHALGDYGGILPRLETSLPGPWVPIGLAAVLGLAANYLGPSAKIHVLWNPIVLLITWNVLVFALLAAASAIRRAGGPPPERPAAPAPRPRRHRAVAHRPGLVERLVLGPLSAWLLRLRAGAEELREGAAGAAAVGRRFVLLWGPLVRPALGLWLRRTMHLSAIGLAIGAITGMYVRGLFFAYDVIWQSTFVTNPAVVGAVLRALLSPAAFVLGRPVPGPSDVARLLSPEGAPAAPWIHLFAVSALLFIALPRSVLAVLAARRLAQARRNLHLDLDAPYYEDLVARARAISPRELEVATRSAVGEESRQVAGRIAEFVSVELYDGRIAPRLRRFREEGGTLRDLEEDLIRECQSFSPELERELATAERDLERRLAERVRRLLGEEGGVATRPSGGLAGPLSAASSRAASVVGDRVSGDLTTIVAGVVSASAAVVVGTITGGFGEALGVALLVGLVESGPVAWVIGALGGLVATAAAFVLGRERLREGLKTVRLPAAALRMALWSGRFERLIADGRARFDRSVRESLAVQMDELSSVIADHLWTRLRPVLGEWQRPRVRGEDGTT